MTQAARIVSWSELEEPARRELLRRPAQLNAVHVLARVREIVADVCERGDEALREYALRFDGATLDELQVAEAEFAAAGAGSPATSTPRSTARSTP
jgi:histidinol dehydrogenase